MAAIHDTLEYYKEMHSYLDEMIGMIEMILPLIDNYLHWFPTYG